MKKLERFFDDYSWLLKTGIWILLIFCAGQFFTPVKVAILENMEFDKKRDWVEEKKANREIDLLVAELVMKAQEKGDDYSPRDYFEDLKKVNGKETEIGEKLGYDFSYGFPFKLINLQNINRKSIGKKFTHHDIEIARVSYRKWLETRAGYREECYADIEEKGWDESLKCLLNWAMTLYSRAFFLIILLYCVRMSERKGILETILADKTRFLSSVLLWPVFLFRYPFNVVREIRVEAELRRLGKFFRHLSAEEKKLAQEVAQSGNCQNWIKQFRLVNSHSFERTLFAALIPAILLYVFSPAIEISFAQQAIQARDGSTMTKIVSAFQEIENGNIDQRNDNSDDGDYPQKTGTEALIIQLITFGSSAIIKVFWGRFPRQIIVQKIEHVPIFGYFNFGQFTIHQLK
ncbi:MAG: hypothetical protein U9M90_02780 [Patescibacteria group bacterium]|nr:hypothetical protein [Patescibacteria group bacterium]